MGKKNFIIIGVTILIFVIAIISILLSNNKKNNWTRDILNAQEYQISMTNCNGREKILDKKIITTINTKWDMLSNNGPWMGDNNSCYTTVTISYENNGIVNEKEILIIDDTSIALIQSNDTAYYTNAGDIINYLNDIFIS